MYGRLIKGFFFLSSSFGMNRRHIEAAALHRLDVMQPRHVGGARELSHHPKRRTQPADAPVADGHVFRHGIIFDSDSSPKIKDIVHSTGMLLM